MCITITFLEKTFSNNCRTCFLAIPKMKYFYSTAYEMHFTFKHSSPLVQKFTIFIEFHDSTIAISKTKPREKLKVHLFTEFIDNKFQDQKTK